ncbi:alpha-hydroxy-acid oxidizing protein [Massilia sp. Se16.2.3]|uniref:alpha-hydroxy-acid oxidizing protein n=1 Tax=Massilia sp. Se16.2.3 TaxID=2709303 RepID=UPI0015FFE4FA|nr:alpha-hydroxy-acid oxidizing protein [Massilia sp. Se16.2.3]QNB01455.1 hypothetical protein G4G31_17235 [Massilia sp. Se16.2.3]
MIIASALDFRAAARRRLPPFLFHYVDGGAAPGARLCMRRRPAARSGVEQLLAILENELRTAMVLTGVKSVREIGPELLVGP